MILASATLGNSHELAKRFFGPEGNYEIIKGTGRRGPLTLRIHYEEKPKELLYQKLQEWNTDIEAELNKYAQLDNYTTWKGLLYLDHKMTLNFEQASNRLSQHFDVNHGWKDFKEIMQTNTQFRTDPLLMGLAITTMFQTSFDFPSISRGLWYGTPQTARDKVQLLGRYNRNPNQHGVIDIILRAFNQHEAQLAQPEQFEEFLKLLSQPPDIPREQPWFTSETLKLTILWGLLVGMTVGYTNGFSEVLSHISEDFQPFVDQEFFQQQLQKACWELGMEGYINYNDDGKLVPTRKTKEWIFKRVKIEENPSYSIIHEQGSKKKKLGTIEYQNLIRHCLVGQYLYWKRKNYAIKRVNKENHELYIESVPLSDHYFTNKIEETVSRTKLMAIDHQNKIALVDVIVTKGLKKPDKRMKNPPNEVVSPLSQPYSGIVIEENSRLLSIFSVQSIKALIDHLTQVLHIESTELDLIKFQDPILGSGVLVLDKSWIHLARLIFDFIQYQVKKQPIQDDNRALKEISQIDTDKILALPFAKGMKRLKEFLHRYHVVYMIIADFHINGNPFVVDGQPVDFKEFCYDLLYPLTLAKTAPVKQFALVFLGDTYDWSNVKNAPIAKKQFQILIEVLKELKLLDKTVFIRGNHDYSEQFFLHQTPLYVRDRLELEVNPSVTATVEHGDNQGLEYYLSKSGSIKENLLEWRKAKRIPDNDCRVFGHTHDIGRCLKKIKTMLVPSLRRYCNEPLNKKLGWLGLFAYGNSFESDCWDIAIDS